MNSAIERLLSLRVENIMTREVHEVSPNQTMDKAAEILTQHQISGAPVVDAGRVVGILTANDFVQWHAKHHGPGEEPDGLVHSQMTPSVQTVPAEATLMDAARRMCNQHVHHLPVLNDQGQIEGFVSSLDIAAALVKSIDE